MDSSGKAIIWQTTHNRYWTQTVFVLIVVPFKGLQTFVMSLIAIQKQVLSSQWRSHQQVSRKHCVWYWVNFNYTMGHFVITISKTTLYLTLLQTKYFAQPVCLEYHVYMRGLKQRIKIPNYYSSSFHHA